MHRKIMSILLLLIILVSSFTPVFAAEQEYTIDSAEFLIFINEDGSATVTERWTVTYEEGEFSRFYKNIYTNLPDEEEFDIEFLEASVDGQPCKYTNNTSKRKDYTYSVVKESDTVRYEIYMNSEDETREFSITYVLYDVVKNVDDEYYLFRYRLLPKGFKKNIEDFYATVYVPDGSDVLDVTSNQGDYGYLREETWTHDRNVNDLYKMSVEFDGDMKDSVYIDDAGSGWDDDGGSFADVVVPVGLFAIGFTLFIVFLVRIDRKKEKELRAELAINPYLLNTLYQKWVPHYFTPAEFSWLLTNNRCLSYMVHLAELMHRNFINMDSEYQYITYPKNYGNDSIIRILDEARLYAEKKRMECPQDVYYWYLPVAYLEKFFVSNKGYGMLQREIYTPLSKAKNMKDKTLRQDVSKMKAIAQLLHKDKVMPFMSFATIATQYHNSAHYVPYFCFQSKETIKDEIDDMSALLTSIALTAYAAHASSSTDVGSSCSSCGGGCGGCGGCGGSD